MIQDEVESQLSAMFDGELPVTECELLSRRIDRDENLRARWSRYALIGAAMRSEPVATAPSGFARRVTAALYGDDKSRRQRGGRTMFLSVAVSATMVVTVAGLSISLLRDAAVVARGGDATQAAAAPVRAGAALQAVSAHASVLAAPAVAGIRRGSNGEPVSYVTPASIANPNTALRTELADFIVAHSEYSTPLMRRNLLSALVSNEDAADNASAGVGAAGAPASAAPGAFDASSAASASSH